jgi:hypothetical protein
LLIALPIAAAIIFGGCGGKNDQAASPRPVVLYPGANCGPAAAKPDAFTITCADGGISFAGLKWQGWGGRIATATGVVNVAGCDPDCADDNRTYTYAIKVTAHQPVDCPGGRRQYAFISWDVTDDHVDSNTPQGSTIGYDC